MIFYFTGTGNSKYIARVIAETLNDSVVEAAQSIKTGECPEWTSEQPYVFVAPTYAWRFPRVFREWMEKCKFGGNKKAYFVLTCGGEIGAAGNYIEKFALKMGFDYMGTAQVVMPDNYIIMFAPEPDEKNKNVISQAEIYTATLCERIVSGTVFDNVKIKFVDQLKSGMVNDGFYRFYIGAKKFYATDGCLSCGKCVENCMMNNIHLKDGKPVWSNDCTHCMACIGKCPTGAIEYGKNTVGRRRYVCPEREK